MPLNMIDASVLERNVPEGCTLSSHVAGWIVSAARRRSWRRACVGTPATARLARWLFTVVAMLGFCAQLRAQSLTLAWDPCSSPAVTGYDIYWGNATGDYADSEDAGTNTTVTISNLIAGTTYFFATTCYSAAGAQSSFSTEIEYIMPTNSVAAPGTATTLSQTATNNGALANSTGNELTNGLVAWYPLAGDANDYSGNGNNGTIVGSPTYGFGPTGTTNTALRLNGSSDYVSLGHPSLYNFGTNNFTFSLWFQTKSTSIPQQLFSCDDVSGRQFIFDINDLSSGTVTAYFLNKSSVVGYRTGHILSSNTWYHAVLVRQGNAPGALMLYLNGTAVASFSSFQNDFPFTMGATTSDVEIGHRTYANYNEWFSGSLSGVRVYDRALSTSEVGALYTNGLPAVSALSNLTNGLMAWYPLAGNASDYSGNGNNGTSAGNPSYTTSVNGAANSALRLNGTSQYVSLGHPSLYNFGSNDFTFSLWFQTTTIAAPQQLFSCDAVSGRQFIFDIDDVTTGTVSAYLLNQSSVVGYRTGNILAPNTWYFAVLERRGNSPGALKLYLNGEAVASFAAFQNDFPFTMQATSSEVDIGRRTYTNYNELFSGSLSGIRVYNRALSAGEINTIYTNDLAAASATIASLGGSPDSPSAAIAMSVALNASETAPVAAKTGVIPNLNILINGQGSVASNLNNKALQPGKKCTLTAAPANGWVFANWVRDGMVAATTRQYSFLLGSNDVLQADFVPNPFLPVAGTYYGLFSVPNDPTVESSGAVAITVTRQGAFSAKLRLGAQSYPFFGGFSITGSSRAYIPRLGLNPLTAQMQLGPNHGQLTGAISDRTWTAALLAEASVYSKSNLFPQAGKYTLLLPGGEKASPQSVRNRYGLVTVSDAGTVTFSGILGDGTPITSTGPVTGQGNWPFYVSLHGGRASIMGWLTFADDGHIGGELGWFKLP
jgi:hypothetical protein